MAVIEGASRRGDLVGNATHDLYRQYGRQIYAYCYHRLRSKEEAEDAVQTTFMNAFRALQRGASTQFEQAWLFKIAQNVCIARHSSSARRLSLEAPNDFEVLQEVVPAQASEGSLELMGVEEALEAMPENQRRAILLREWQGLSYREISEELCLSQAAVEMLIFRARRTLAGALEQPDQVREKKLGRKVVGSLGSALGALKTLLGGGAAIKAVTIAAAAIAVVGESAQHTIVRPSAVVKKSAPVIATTAAHARVVAAALAPTVVHQVRSLGSTAATRSAIGSGSAVPAAQHRAHATATALSALRVRPDEWTHAGTATAPVTPAAPVAPAPAAPVTAPTVTTTATAPVSAPAAPPAAPPSEPKPVEPQTKKDDPSRQDASAKKSPGPAPTPIQAPVQTQSAPPTTTTTTPTTTTPTTTDPQPQHGNDDHGHGHGNGNGNGHGKDKGDPAPTVTAPTVTTPTVTAPVVTAPIVTAPVVTTPAVTVTTPTVPDAQPGHGHGNGKQKGP